MRGRNGEWEGQAPWRDSKRADTSDARSQNAVGSPCERATLLATLFVVADVIVEIVFWGQAASRPTHITRSFRTWAPISKEGGGMTSLYKTSKEGPSRPQTLEIPVYMYATTSLYRRTKKECLRDLRRVPRRRGRLTLQLSMRPRH
jgi:hypothetical protein